MLGRQVTVALRRPLQARLSTIAPRQPYLNLSIRTFSHAPCLLDPVDHPRKAVGEPSKPVKRAVKAAAKKPASPKTEAAAGKVAEKKRLANERKELKATMKKEKEKDAAAAKRAKDRTPEALAAKKAALLKADIKELEEAALKPPFPKPSSAFRVFTAEKGEDLKAMMAKQTEGRSREFVQAQVKQHTLDVGAAWKELGPSDIEHYNHLAHTAMEARVAEYKRWVESHTPLEIRLANSARYRLRRREQLPKKMHTKWREIVDERAPKKAVQAFALFVTDRSSSGDFKNISPPDRMKLIGQEWRALSEEEKSKYVNLHRQDRARFDAEIASLSDSSTA